MFYFLSFCVIIVSGGEYMTINERWKLARKTLNLTQSQVGINLRNQSFNS